MKKIIFVNVLIMFFMFCVMRPALCATLNLKATWTANTESDMAGYNLYRTDATRTKINSTLIPHPPSLPYLFSVTVPDGSQGVLTFVLTAVDTANNESADSAPASYNYNLDTTSPLAPKNLGVTK
jgi:hypothetical protein